MLTSAKRTNRRIQLWTLLILLLPAVFAGSTYAAARWPVSLWLSVGVSQPPRPAESTTLSCTEENGKYCVYKETSSNVCRVSTHATTLGDELLGPYDTHAQAVAAMCHVYVPGSGDDDKCGTVVPDNACH